MRALKRERQKGKERRERKKEKNEGKKERKKEGKEILLPIMRPNGGSRPAAIVYK